MFTLSGILSVALFSPTLRLGIRNGRVSSLVPMSIVNNAL